ncbi:LacI family transcriptional regulator [Bifidobacterium simiarum]|uniref:LacI family transcriptional regulator n=1 Tax=Bifidobacterium simiarum TaxID=2045441 RepID=A0A2M9HFQ0_9BIFI|nr:LacI family transcriptional regulator [Bifidobacterium simiarum]
MTPSSYGRLREDRIRFPQVSKTPRVGSIVLPGPGRYHTDVSSEQEQYDDRHDDRTAPTDRTGNPDSADQAEQTDRPDQISQPDRIGQSDQPSKTGQISQPDQPGRPDQSDQVTISDVAKAAGVSIATVSRTFRRPDRVNVNTLNHVRAVAERLGYHTQIIRPRSESNLAGLIALTVNDLNNPVYSQIAHGVQRECGRRGFGLMISETEGSITLERAIIKRSIPHVDGMILCSPRLSDWEVRKAAQSRPLAVMIRMVGGVQSLYADDTPAINETIAAIARLGHREVTYLPGPDRAWGNSLRVRALQSACHATGMRLRHTQCAYPVGRHSARAFAEFLRHPTTAVIAYNDEVAYAFMRFAHDHGLDVPGAVSVVGIDDIPMCEVCSPTLASIAVPRQEMARMAARKVIDQVLHNADGSTAPVVLPSRFVPRDSLGPVR